VCGLGPSAYGFVTGAQDTYPDFFFRKAFDKKEAFERALSENLHMEVSPRGVTGDGHRDAK
jgi:hypothetical protein